MLPFLKPKPVAGLSISYRKPDEDKVESQEDSNGLESAANDLIKAVQAGDAKAVAAALQAAFEICDSQPHEEGPHIEDENEGNE